jgi:hypothetical protein
VVENVVLAVPSVGDQTKASLAIVNSLFSVNQPAGIGLAAMAAFCPFPSWAIVLALIAELEWMNYAATDCQTN